MLRQKIQMGSATFVAINTGMLFGDLSFFTKINFLKNYKVISCITCLNNVTVEIILDELI